MKIIKVLVDEMPKACVTCEALIIPLIELKGYCGICNFTRERVYGNFTRHPNCPLRLEHDNKKIAESVM